MTPRPQGRQPKILPLGALVLASSMITSCTTSDPAPQAEPTRGPSLAQCRSYGVRSAPVSLKLPDMVQYQIESLGNRNGTGPRLALRAVDQAQPDKDATALATLFDGPAASTPKGIRSGIYVANIDDAAKWQVKNVDEDAISLSPGEDTAQATQISRATFTASPGAGPITFDYWAFTARGHRYLLSYARTPDAKTPDAATFFATATSCPTASSSASSSASSTRTPT